MIHRYPIAMNSFNLNTILGNVPIELDNLGCIVNLAGNPGLSHGEDVTREERQALEDLYRATDGMLWTCNTRWMTDENVCTWYKVGVLASHVHSIVMSSNNVIEKS
jgi:hypothetical protein